MEMEFQFSQMRRLKMDGDSCTTLRMYLLPLNSTLREIRMVNSVMCHFTIIKNWGKKISGC